MTDPLPSIAESPAGGVIDPLAPARGIAVALAIVSAFWVPLLFALVHP